MGWKFKRRKRGIFLNIAMLLTFLWAFGFRVHFDELFPTRETSISSNSTLNVQGDEGLSGFDKNQPNLQAESSAKRKRFGSFITFSKNDSIVGAFFSRGPQNMNDRSPDMMIQMAAQITGLSADRIRREMQKRNITPERLSKLTPQEIQSYKAQYEKAVAERGNSGKVSLN